MPLPNDDNTSTTQPGALPDTSGDSGGGQETFTRKQVDELIASRMRGVLNEKKKSDERLSIVEQELARKRQDDEAAAKKKLEEDGKWKELHQAEAAEKAKYAERVKELEEKENTRLKKVVESNEERLKKLPKEFHKFAHPSLSPDDLADVLSHAEDLARQGSENVVNVHGGSGRTKPKQPEDSNSFEANKRKGMNYILGIKDKK